MLSVTMDDVAEYTDRFRVLHFSECFFFGNVTKAQASKVSDDVIRARKRFLECLASRKRVEVERNEHLEEWFVSDPVERIVGLEKALMKRCMKGVTKSKKKGRRKKTQPLDVEGGGGHGMTVVVQVRYTWHVFSQLQMTCKLQAEREQENT